MRTLILAVCALLGACASDAGYEYGGRPQWRSNGYASRSLHSALADCRAFAQHHGGDPQAMRDCMRHMGYEWR